MNDIKQIKNIKSTPKRQAVINLFIALTILLLVLPLYNTISDVFTRIVINFDWYHPQNCTRHTTEEVRGWFAKAGLKVTHEFTDFYGITMRGKK